VLGLPVYELLGGLQRDRVPLYANINRAMFGKDRSPEAFAGAAMRAREAGFRVIKIALVATPLSNTVSAPPRKFWCLGCEVPR
jgi:L-alanine-DL-glutamate epimerase-like enolase superfamily enzyme